MNSQLVALENVTKSYGSFVAVDDVSFIVRRGEFFSLLGPSGCGKTTLLRMLGGFEIPEKGQIYIDGQASTSLPADKRPTNTVFQSYALFPHLTIAENIAYGLRTLAIDRAQKKAIVAKSLSMIRLADKADAKPQQLSGGQRQRVALARALARQPKVLLLDEPLSALDKQLREDMQLELREIQRRVGITFIFVTHDQDEALAMSDRVAVMSVGRVVQIGTPGEIYESPVSRDVASFIGTMNFFPGTFLGYEQENAIVDAGPVGTMKVFHNSARCGPRQGDNVLVAIRPEKISWNSSDHENVVRGDLGASSYFGDRSHIYVSIAGIDRPISVARQNSSRQWDGSDPAVALSWPPENAILLPPNGPWNAKVQGSK